MILSLDTVLQLLQIVISLVTLAGVGYAAGRFSSRFEALERSNQELKTALFGGDQQEGIFLRRTEAELLIHKNDSEHEEFRRRFDGLELRRGNGV